MRLPPKNVLRGVLILFLLGGVHPYLVAQSLPYSLSLRANYTTSSKLSFDIAAFNELFRDQYVSLDNIFGYTIDVRRSFPAHRFELGLSVEYLSTIETFQSRTVTGTVPIEQGFRAIPVELSGYFIIPFSTDLLRFYMGGGAGVYFGERIYSVAGERAESSDRKAGVGIHVVVGVDYSITSWLAVRSELKFRDFHFESSDRFLKKSVVYNGQTIYLDQTPTRSRLNIDGMLIDAGVIFRF